MINKKNKFTLTLQLILLFICYPSIANNQPNELMVPLIKPQVAEELILPDLSGKLVNLKDYRGHYVLIHFWAHWCSPCIKEFPALQLLYDSMLKKHQRFEIIAVHTGELPETMSTFLDANNITFNVVIDQDINLKGWFIPVLPVSYLISPEGNIIYQTLGPKEWQPELMQQLL
jgi:thiol-disulfide isomerase/thioredoxin